MITALVAFVSGIVTPISAKWLGDEVSKRSARAADSQIHVVGGEPEDLTLTINYLLPGELRIDAMPEAIREHWDGPPTADTPRARRIKWLRSMNGRSAPIMSKVTLFNDSAQDVVIADVIAVVDRREPIKYRTSFIEGGEGGVIRSLYFNLDKDRSRGEFSAGPEYEENADFVKKYGSLSYFAASNTTVKAGSYYDFVMSPKASRPGLVEWHLEFSVRVRGKGQDGVMRTIVGRSMNGANWSAAVGDPVVTYDYNSMTDELTSYRN